MKHAIPRSTIPPIVGLCGAAFLWAIEHPLTKILLSDWSSATILLARSFIAGLLIGSVYFLIYRSELFSLKAVANWPSKLLALGGLQAVCVASYLIGSDHVNASLTAVILNLFPLSMAFWGWLLSNEGLPRRFLICFTLALGGIVLPAIQTTSLSTLLSQFSWGILPLFVTQSLYAISVVKTNQWFPLADKITISIARSVVSSILLFTAFALGLFEANLAEIFQDGSWSNYGILVIVAAAGLIALALYLHGVQERGAGYAGFFNNLVPVFAAVLGIVMELFGVKADIVPNMWHWFGIALVVFSTAWFLRANKSREDAQ